MSITSKKRLVLEFSLLFLGALFFWKRIILKPRTVC
jgi:hypothetical protein